VLSLKHTDDRWVGYDTAVTMLKYDNNKNALWELDFRLRRGLLPELR
jgi:dATP pyrophosphohydrolase